MPHSVDQWSDQYWDRVFARQTAQVDTAKLIVTFSLLVAATFVAAALLGPPMNGFDVAASIVILLAFVVTGVILVWLDRLQWPNREQLLNRQHRLNWDDNALLAYIRDVHRDAEVENNRVVRIIRIAALLQFILATAASILAAISLFQSVA